MKEMKEKLTCLTVSSLPDRADITAAWNVLSIVSYSRDDREKKSLSKTEDVIMENTQTLENNQKCEFACMNKRPRDFSAQQETHE